MSTLLWIFATCLLLSSNIIAAADDSAVQGTGGLRRRKAQGGRCGCTECSEAVWSRPATDPVTLVSYTCGERIEYLISQGTSEEDACRKVAGEEFAVVCGRECNPNRCDGRYFVPNAVSGGTLEYNTVTNLTPQYCFPEPESRATWNNVWGKYTLQGKLKADSSRSDDMGCFDPNNNRCSPHTFFFFHDCAAKEGPAPCGPGDNMFSSNLVSVNGNNDEVTLQYRMVNGQWTGSEVRAVLPDEERPFMYGSYSFSVKEVIVREASTGAVISNRLPISLVLGMFSWDPTDDYATHENYNHEVDVEISQWNIPDNADAQFLVQPPQEPQFKRFFSGGAEGNYQQTGIWSFAWTPNSVNWHTTAGGGQTHAYSSADANYWGVPDRVQCLPADIEVRLNLWNLLGTKTPTGMSDDQVVEVIIDNFTYIPSGIRNVADGEACTQRCQCEAGSDCINGLCSKPQAQSDETVLTFANPDPVPAPVPAAVPNPAPFSPALPATSTLPASCSAHSDCSGLANECCPTPDGVMLDCCQASRAYSVSSVSPPIQSSTGNAMCEANAGCSALGLAGACCPTPSGVTLDCCNL
jgi:hypothetical protein